MSHVSGAVQFPDGKIMYCEYNGTADFMQSALYETHEEMGAAWRSGARRSCNCAGIEEVNITCCYGGHRHWRGTACRKCKALVEGTDPYLQCKDEIKPEDEARVDLQYGTPAWSPFEKNS